MKRHLTLSAAVLITASLALSGCSGAKDAVENAAGGLATSAASKAAEAAQSVVRQKLCSIASDGQISASESATLSTLISKAEAAGVPTSITEPARRIANTKGTPPQDAVDAVKKECAKTQ